MSALNLLYIDDDPDIRTIVEMALALDPGMVVCTAPSGAVALALAGDPGWRTDVILLDIMMPDMDGIATLHALRRLPGLATIPAVFMTARARDADLARYRAEGAAGVIVKPFDPIHLASEIRTLIARP